MRNIFAVFSSILLVAALSITAQAQNYLTFTAVDGDAMFGLINQGSYDFPVIEYSFDKASWETLPASVLRSIPDGQSVYLRGLNSAISADDEKNITYFRMIGKIAASGSVMSLLDGIGESKDIGADYCFAGLFANCASLTSAPELPATKLSNYCYEAMFQGCSNLEHAPALPASQLAENCYYTMFNSCTSLANAPELPATQLAPGCYAGMFYNCSGLAVAPSLPAMQLADECYFSMFQGCTGLKEAPGLPAIQLADNCYYQMFYGCSSLASAPDLPAMQLTSTCYAAMFYNCTSLTKAPKLPAAQLADYCYYAMFYGCQNLSQIEVGFTEWDNSATNNWVNGVADNGLFIAPEGLSKVYGTSNIPEGWRVATKYNEPLEGDFLTFTAVDGDAKFRIMSSGDYDLPVIEVSSDRIYWTELLPDYDCAIPEGGSVYMRGSNTSISQDIENVSYFSMEGKIAASGSVMSLIDGTGESKEIGADYCFAGLFYNCQSLIQAPDLPAVKLADRCYYAMFQGCTSLTNAPELPATQLANDCYYIMFMDCTSLTEVPEMLPAEPLAPGCYAGMFSGCSGLTKAPSLPAKQLADGCYYAMFQDCASLVDVPDTLPADYLADSCYFAMFLGCTSLAKAPELPATHLADRCYYEMFLGCKSLAEAPETLPADQLARECYYAMFQNCVKLAKAPKLPATRLAGKCYSLMFNGCSSLVDVPETLPADQLADECYLAMFQGCSSLVKAPDLPASQWASQCYYLMFNECTSLVEAPEKLPASQLADSCCAGMFQCCSALTKAPVLTAAGFQPGCYAAIFQYCPSLSQIEVEFSEWDTSATIDWVYGVETTNGTFIAPEGLSKVYGRSYIPEGWQTATKYSEPLEGDFLTFTAVDGDAKFRIMSSGDYDLPVIEVSSDRIYWTELLPDYDCAIPEGGSVYMRGSNTSISQDIENASYFSMEGKIAASGSVMSLIDGKGESKDIGADYCFAGLFYNCQSLIQAPRLPATKLSDNCYEAMFKGCSGLTEAPVLPAEELKEGCYAELFSNCQSLRQIEVKFTEWENSATKKWVDGVETAGGRFIAPQALAGIYGKSHIPVLWMPDGIIPIQQTAESINLTACPGDTAVIDLEMCIERPDYFKAEGIHSDWQAWESESENKIKIPIPEDEAGFGHKILTIHFHNSDGSGANPISASLSINYPNRYIGVIYSDILYVDNHEGIFQQYQWLGADGSEIAGATGQFLQVKSLPSRGGIFSAKITTKSGANLRICPLKVEPAKISKSAEFSIKAYPSPVLSGQEFAIELIGLPGPMLDGCRVSIINSAGTAVKSFHGTEFPVKTQLPPGQYSVVAVSGNARSTFKIVVK